MKTFDEWMNEVMPSGYTRYDHHTKREYNAAKEVWDLFEPTVEKLSAENEQLRRDWEFGIEIEQELRAELEKVRAWQEAGEKILSTPYYKGLSFSIGKWWGERPWK